MSAREQELFETLSVFVGGCTLEAAEAVCAADVDGLASLVDKSLLRQSGGRFWMLETIREFALERLRERNALGEVRRRHADFFLAGAEAANHGPIAEALTREEVHWFEQEQDNVRVAIDVFAEQDTEPEREVRLVLACGKYWMHYRSWPEYRRRHEVALGRAGDVPAPLRARLLWGAAEAAWTDGDYGGARRLAEASLDLYLRLPDSTAEALGVRITVAICEALLGNTRRAAELLEAAAVSARASGNDLELAMVVSSLGNLALDQRDFRGARTYSGRRWS